MPSPHNFDPTILREYDVRGIVGETLSRDDARALGRAFGTIAGETGATTVCVGYDGRTTSPQMEAAVVEGLSQAGIAAKRVGLGPTPMLYFAIHHLSADGGIMITGSHNPPDHNGFKMMLGGKPFFGSDIQRLGEVAARGAFADVGEVAEPSVESVATVSVDEPYLDILVEAYDGTGEGEELKVAWDAGNGAAGEIMARLTQRLPGTHMLLNETIDGSFPSHHPDPTVAENLAQLQDTVRREGCDLGIAFDGDGDRIGVVDGEGEILWGDQLMVALAGEVLEDMPGATIIADVKASQVLFDEIARMGGTPLMGRTGHSLIKAQMAETGAPLAGEMSGHIFFADRYFGYDDALYAAVRLLRVVARGGESLADLRKRLPKVVNTPELRFDCADTRKFAVIEEVKARLAAEGTEINDMDGVRVQTSDGWWLLRASNTQAVLVARCESGDKEGLERLKADLVDQLRQSGVEPPKF
ncbi:MAG: phosphomannomutase/phosphoglucomutase [Alphaproteobacteria bacterium]|nr:phosphomannomutase/phosphoglucomutase [Alphaproteobacteria bacterium]